MPYASKAQAAYFHIHRAELEKQGVNIEEWDAASKGKKMPEHAKSYHRLMSSAPPKSRGLWHGLVKRT